MRKGVPVNRDAPYSSERGPHFFRLFCHLPTAHAIDNPAHIVDIEAIDTSGLETAVDRPTKSAQLRNYLLDSKLRCGCVKQPFGCLARYGKPLQGTYGIAGGLFFGKVHKYNAFWFGCPPPGGTRLITIP